MTLRVGVLGAGSFGTTIAHVISRNAPVILWCRGADTADEINTRHTNDRYLPGYRIAEAVRATATLEDAVRELDVLVLAVPSGGLREVLEKAAAFIRPWVPIVSLAKGLEPGRHLRMSEVIREVLPHHPAGVLTGPNLAKEIMAGYAAASVIAFERTEIARQLQTLFKSGVFRVYTNHDVTGCELGGALKNVVAIATGMGDGLGVGDNTRSAVITRGLAELTRLGVALGGEQATFAGLAGMGDLIATCTSPQSRNRYVGHELGKGRSIEDIKAEMHQVAEGIKTTRVVMELSEKLGIDMPIAREVHGVLYEGRSARDAYRGLTRRDPGAEGDPD
ncbi:MAG: NAD(P)H-dependent glycerol-3-phosphate dehydrogenase [Myxococcales bacterium]|nr:NAD(P)H-dependent glycerol-3-phosphate dehydrogenase [Myxococcales bacterium]